MPHIWVETKEHVRLNHYIGIKAMSKRSHFVQFVHHLSQHHTDKQLKESMLDALFSHKDT